MQLTVLENLKKKMWKFIWSILTVVRAVIGRRGRPRIKLTVTILSCS